MTTAHTEMAQVSEHDNESQTDGQLHRSMGSILYGVIDIQDEQD